MPRARKEVPVEIFSGPPPARQDSWKGTPLEEPDPPPADFDAREQSPKAPPEPATEATNANPDDSGVSEKAETVGYQPAAATEPAPDGPPADEAQPAVAPAEEPMSHPEPTTEPTEAAVGSVFGSEEPDVALPASPTPAACEGGNAARKELEDAIQRIEAHIMSERAARRAAEGALAQALQVTSPAETPAIVALTGLAQGELQVVLGDLVNAQQAMQRAHGLVAALLAGTALPAMVSNSVAQTPSVVAVALPMGAPAATATAAKPPTVVAAAVECAEDGEAMKWNAGARYGGHVANLKVRTGRRAPTAAGPPESLDTPTGEVGRRARGAGTPVTASRSPAARSPTRGRREATARTPAAAAEKGKESEDRFETRKTDAFMLRHSARWEPQ